MMRFCNTTAKYVVSLLGADQVEDELFTSIWGLFEWDSDEAKVDGGVRMSKRFSVIITSLMNGPAESLEEEVRPSLFRVVHVCLVRACASLRHGPTRRFAGASLSSM